jgi:hypothetical protein
LEREEDHGNPDLEVLFSEHLETSVSGFKKNQLEIAKEFGKTGLSGV